MMPPYGTPPPYAAMYAQGTPYQQAPMPPVSLHLLLMHGSYNNNKSNNYNAFVSLSGFTPIQSLSYAVTKWNSSNSSKLMNIFLFDLAECRKIFTYPFQNIADSPILLSLIFITYEFICSNCPVSFVSWKKLRLWICDWNMFLDIWCWRYRDR